MRNKNFLIIFLIIIGGLILWRAEIINKPKEIAEQDRKFFNLKVGENDLRVEVVTTSESIKLGLGKRDEIGCDGMLFVFPSRRIAAFWMKDMKFKIDIIWIDGEKITGIIKNIPYPDPAVSQNRLELYSPKAPIDKALELKGGDADRLGIKVGDRVKL